ncbi:UDP-N-acetylmuramyl tripeptide synthase [Thermosyntropha lipolytica DSM 11003]|uniref:Lipid II isoglutaminyl synthase (glutamine-hydrolyzing) subunit MurT n=1 Tax=Thermosyntropha lipolytica DSM 11003 TaxID=1123382 RepID=A0A1M5KB03_9FIRM|nr:Mur ligase family protein [Thermosyntropha lipolytica]SHG49629.1 UDP-N-acetylmuramyl tripeptide synthase [Thermosyntropha lipolytica DSM 11003]
MLRKIIAIMLGKIVWFILKILGRQATVLPGRVARLIDRDILKKLSRNISEEIIVITGTNGKTTTSNMLAGILKEKGYRIVHNQAGANMLTGITTAFIKETDIKGRKKHHYAILETDEANVPLLLNEVKPRMILITNFFRDQLDRYGELDHTVRLIKESIKGKSLELVLNADDPMVAHLASDTGATAWYYGFSDTDYDSLESRESREGRYCIFCGHEISYRRYHYAQLGSFFCPKCGYHNPEPHFTGYDLSLQGGISLRINDLKITSSYQGFYNAYNILAAVAAAKLLGIENEVIEQAIKKYLPPSGRMETFIINGKPAVLVLVKNPTGLNQTLHTLQYDKRSKDVFFALNDNAADGRDVSWIWDADVEMINDINYKMVICSGKRSGDIAVRMKYAGVDSERIIIRTLLKEGIEEALRSEGETAYILSTYTALFACRDILQELQTSASAGEKGSKSLSAV